MGEIRKHETPDLRPSVEAANADESAEDTEFKLAALASLHPNLSQEQILELLLCHGGSIEGASAALTSTFPPTVKRKRALGSSAAVGYQSSLDHFTSGSAPRSFKAARLSTKKGKTLHLYGPREIEANTPCSLIHNFLSPSEADALLRELLSESATYQRASFQLFDRTVQSPHTFRFYVDSAEAVRAQRTEYPYDGLYEANDVARSTPELLRVQQRVRDTVNAEIRRRTLEFNPGKAKLKFQSRDQDWLPNASFVNCYDGGSEHVGYHSDQLTYLGPRAVIGSLSLGVAREFRVRRIVPSPETEDGDESASASADEQGQIAIHLPHNSLLVMHAEMQEEWKHSIAPAQAIDPHPIAGRKRLNVTYRCYRDYLHPRYTPRCKCGVSCVLRCVQRRRATRGRYMWMCHANYTPGRKGCAHFEWAEFDEDGRPPWVEGYKGNANGPAVHEAADEDGAGCHDRDA